MTTERDADRYNAGFDAGFKTAQAMGPATGWTHSEALLFTLIGVWIGIVIRGWL